jgi:SAM-dependent methyltransferase
MRPPLTLNAWLRYDHVRRLLRDLPHVRSVLELGPGAGAVAARLCERYDYVGVEPDPDACALARVRVGAAGEVLCGDDGVLPRSARFDLVCGFELLEHMEDDAAVLRRWRERVREGGFILLSVPAHARRFGPHDRLVGHYRRYDPEQLAELLRECGFARPVVLSCGFPLGYALETARNAIGRLARAEQTMAERTASSGRRLQPPQWLGPVTQAATAPFRLLQRPFARTGLGTGLVVLAQRAG